MVFSLLVRRSSLPHSFNCIPHSHQWYIISHHMIGGGTDLRPGTQFFEAAQVVYREALASNARGDYFPLWGTCMRTCIRSITISI
jgi:hypothetical protein